MGVDDIKGKGKEAAGKATGNKRQEREGKGDQVKDTAKDAVDDIKKTVQR